MWIWNMQKLGKKCLIKLNDFALVAFHYWKVSPCEHFNCALVRKLLHETWNSAHWRCQCSSTSHNFSILHNWMDVNDSFDYERKFWNALKRKHSTYSTVLIIIFPLFCFYWIEFKNLIIFILYISSSFFLISQLSLFLLSTMHIIYM